MRFLLFAGGIGSLFFAILFLVSPAFYLASISILYEGRQPVRSYAVYFAAPAVLALGTGLYNGLTAATPARSLGTIPGHFSNVVLTSLTLAADLLYVAAVGAALVAAWRLHRARQVEDQAAFRHQIVFLSCYLASAAIVVAGWILRNERLYAAGCMTAGVAVLCYGLSRTAPHYFAGNRRRLRAGARKPSWDESAPALSAQEQLQFPVRGEVRADPEGLPERARGALTGEGRHVGPWPPSPWSRMMRAA